MPTTPAMHVVQIMEATAGGSRKHLRLIVQALRERQVEVDLILSTRQADADFGDDLALFERLGCHLHLLNMEKGLAWADWPAYRELRRLLAGCQAQVVHTHCAKAGLLGRLAVHRGGLQARVVHTPHSYFFEGFRNPLAIRLGIALERRLCRYTDAVFCVSEAERELLERHRLIDADRIVVGHNGLPQSFYAELLPRAEVRETLGIPEEVVAVALIARMVPKKGHLWLLEAMTRLPPKMRRGVRLCLFGDGPLAETIRRRVAVPPLNELVRVYGYLPAAERYLAGMDVAVLPSSYEGLPYQLLEALGAGLPVIATDIPGNRLRYPGNPIVYVAPGNPGDLAGMIELLATSSADRQTLGRKGQAWVREHYPLGRQVDRLVDLYEQLLSRPPVNR